MPVATDFPRTRVPPIQRGFRENGHDAVPDRESGLGDEDPADRGRPASSSAAVRRGLEAEGFTVDVAFDGDDGLWMANEGSYDAIVLDIMLPGRNGFRVCADLRAPATGRRS